MKQLNNCIKIYHSGANLFMMLVFFIHFAIALFVCLLFPLLLNSSHPCLIYVTSGERERERKRERERERERGKKVQVPGIFVISFLLVSAAAAKKEIR